jgi:hypothetical protein
LKDRSTGAHSWTAYRRPLGAECRHHARCHRCQAAEPGTDKPATYCPSLSGGKNWTPAAYSPQSGLLYIPANGNYCTTMAGTAVEYRAGQNFTGITGVPTSYEVDGVQYVTIQSGWGVGVCGGGTMKRQNTSRS